MTDAGLGGHISIKTFINMEGSDNFDSDEEFEFHDIQNEEELVVQSKVKGIQKKTTWKSCQHCEYKTKELYQMRMHTKRKHSFCIDCDVQFETKEQVFKHIKKFHPKEIFQCDNEDCKKQFFTLHELQVHDHQKTHCCDICDYRAESLERLQIHNNVMHLARKDFQCKKCGYKCGLPEELNRHIEYYHKDPEKLFRCETCDYKTPNKFKLNRHMKTHQVVRTTYFCEFCPKEFLSQWRLTDHFTKTHDSKSQHEWKCQSCKYFTNTKEKLDKHQTVHQSPQFKCDQCDKKFRRATRLKEHKINSHSSKVSEFSCPHCSQVFRIADSRRSHISKKHPNLK